MSIHTSIKIYHTSAHAQADSPRRGPYRPTHLPLFASLMRRLAIFGNIGFFIEKSRNLLGNVEEISTLVCARGIRYCRRSHFFIPSLKSSPKRIVHHYFLYWTFILYYITSDETLEERRYLFCIKFTQKRIYTWLQRIKFHTYSKSYIHRSSSDRFLFLTRSSNVSS